MDLSFSFGMHVFQIYAQVGDVTKDEDIKSFVAKSVSKFGKINSLVRIVLFFQIYILETINMVPITCSGSWVKFILSSDKCGGCKEN